MKKITDIIETIKNYISHHHFWRFLNQTQNQKMIGVLTAIIFIVIILAGRIINSSYSYSGNPTESYKIDPAASDLPNRIIVDFEKSKATDDSTSLESLLVSVESFEEGMTSIEDQHMITSSYQNETDTPTIIHPENILDTSLITSTNQQPDSILATPTPTNSQVESILDTSISLTTNEPNSILPTKSTNYQANLSVPEVELTTDPNKLYLNLQVVSDTWLEIKIDSDQMAEGLRLSQGESYNWEADEKFILSIGDVEAIQVEINDVQISPISPPGKRIRSYILTRASL